jgi:hypothetical protein
MYFPAFFLLFLFSVFLITIYVFQHVSNFVSFPYGRPISVFLSCSNFVNPSRGLTHFICDAPRRCLRLVFGSHTLLRYLNVAFGMWFLVCLPILLSVTPVLSVQLSNHCSLTKFLWCCANVPNLVDTEITIKSVIGWQVFWAVFLNTSSGNCSSRYKARRWLSSGL